MDYKRFLLRSALLSQTLITALDDLTRVGRLDERAAAFNRQYFHLQKTVAPFAYVPWPSLYNYSEDVVLVFTVLKVLACITFIFDFVSARDHLKNLLLSEMCVNVLGATKCTCFFIQGLCVVAGIQMTAEPKRAPVQSNLEDSAKGWAIWGCCKSSKSGESKKKKYYHNSTSKKSQ